MEILLHNDVLSMELRMLKHKKLLPVFWNKSPKIINVQRQFSLVIITSRCMAVTLPEENSCVTVVAQRAAGDAGEMPLRTPGMTRGHHGQNVPSQE